jgi:hypothetical protein
MDASAGVLYINDSYSYWDSSAHRPSNGDIFQFGYKVLVDGSDQTATFTYMPNQTFSLPEFVQIETDPYGTVNFPAVPIMKDKDTTASPSDVKVFVDSTSVGVQSLNSATGLIVLNTLVSPDSTVLFSYNISDRATVNVFDPGKARIFDDVFDFGGICPDPVLIDTTSLFPENVNFLDDYSSGIKKRYFNKTTWEIENRIFSGPVFELCDGMDDEFSPPESFPGALVPIPDGAFLENPMNRPESFDFVADELVRFRKKTFKELLPDRSFKTTELIEMVPI